MRSPITTEQALASGLSIQAVRTRVKNGLLQRVLKGVYLEGTEVPTPMEYAHCVLVATGGVASHCLAANLYELDGIGWNGSVVSIDKHNRSRHVRVMRRDMREVETLVVGGRTITNAKQTIADLASFADDDVLEQALESALRRKLLTVRDLEVVAQSSFKGVQTLRRVLARRPVGAPPTESLLETLMVQLIRNETDLPEPTRQVWVRNRAGIDIARVDLAWPDRGIFLELDGEQHKGQPRYDARRETAVVAATGWLPGRFTWHEVNRLHVTTARRLTELHESARLRAPIVL